MKSLFDLTRHMNNIIFMPFSTIARQANRIIDPPYIERMRALVGKADTPSHWDKDHYSVKGIDVPVYIAKAKDPVVEFHFCTGFNSTPLAYIPQIETLNKNGITVVATKLLKRDDIGHCSEDEMIKFHLDSTRAFFCNPATKHQNKDIPKIAGTHSAAGGYLALHVANPLSLYQLSKNFRGVASITPFFDVANGSKRFHPMIHDRFMKHAQHKPDAIATKTIHGKLYSSWFRFRGEPQIFSADIEPTNGEIVKLIENGERAFKAHQAATWTPALRHRFMLAQFDTASCSKTAADMADLIGAEKIILDSYHNPVLESDENLYRLIGRLHEMKDTPPIDMKHYMVPKKSQAAAVSAFAAPVRALQAT